MREAVERHSAEMLRGLLAHLRWADERCLEALRRCAEPPPAALEVYAHLLGAEHVWLARLHGEPATVAVWPALTLPECARLAERNAAGLAGFLEGLAPADLAGPVSYHNSAGQAFESTIEDILLHVAMHGSYHRGQVALLLRQSGAEPAPTDYIAFTRGAPAATRRG